MVFILLFFSAIANHNFEKTFGESSTKIIRFFYMLLPTNAILLKNKHCLKISSKVMRLLYLY